MRTPTTQQHASLAPLIPLRTLSATDWLVALCLTTAYLAFMLSIQQPTSINAGQGWDGYYYYQMATGDNLDGVYYRFTLRYGLPWLAGIFPTHGIFLNFKLINLACAFLYTAGSYLLLAACSPQGKPSVPVLAWILLCTGNLAPIPSALWCPVQTDIVCSFLGLIFLAMVLGGRLPLAAVILLFYCGTTVRENFPEFLLLAFLRVELSFNRTASLVDNITASVRQNHLVFTVVTAGFLSSLAALYNMVIHAGQQSGGDIASTLFDLQYALEHNIENLPHLFSITTSALSPVLFIALASLWHRARPLHGTPLVNRPFAKLVLLAFCAIAFLGGTNPERYLYWTMPFFVLCALPAIHSLLANKNHAALGICLLWTLFIQRSLVPIDPSGIKQDCGLLAILTGHSNWLGHWSDQCDIRSQQKLLKLAAGVGTLILATALLEHFRESRHHD